MDHEPCHLVALRSYCIKEKLGLNPPSELLSDKKRCQNKRYAISPIFLAGFWYDSKEWSFVIGPDFIVSNNSLKQYTEFRSFFSEGFNPIQFSSFSSLFLVEYFFLWGFQTFNQIHSSSFLLIYVI